jgi:hypothetical protein
METELRQLAARHGFALQPPAPAELIEAARVELTLPHALCQFYAVTNGLQHEWFRIPPLHDPGRIKQTWDSIQRANDPAKSKFLHGGAEFLKQFLVLAELGGPDYALLRRADDTIWFSEGEELLQTNLDLVEFISTCAHEVDEL